MAALEAHLHQLRALARSPLEHAHRSAQVRLHACTLQCCTQVVCACSCAHEEVCTQPLLACMCVCACTRACMPAPWNVVLHASCAFRCARVRKCAHPAAACVYVCARAVCAQAHACAHACTRAAGHALVLSRAHLHSQFLCATQLLAAEAASHQRQDSQAFSVSRLLICRCQHTHLAFVSAALLQRPCLAPCTLPHLLPIRRLHAARGLLRMAVHTHHTRTRTSSNQGACLNGI